MLYCSISECGIKEGLTKLSRVTAEATQEEKDLLINKRESSHEYDWMLSRGDTQCFLTAATYNDR